MHLTPNSILLREREAGRVKLFKNKYDFMNTPWAKQDYEDAAREFKEKHHEEWKGFVKESKISK